MDLNSEKCAMKKEYDEENYYRSKCENSLITCAEKVLSDCDPNFQIAKQEREISHDQAMAAALRFISGHFRNGDIPHISIPARFDYDDDLVLIAYINQQSRQCG